MPWRDKKLYSEKLIKTIFKEKNIDKTDYQNIIRNIGIFDDYEKENYKKELFAFSIEDYYKKIIMVLEK